MNPRSKFWASQYASTRYQRMLPLSPFKPFYHWKDRAFVFNYLWNHHYNSLMEGIGMYVPKAQKPSHWPEVAVLISGFFIGCCWHHFEVRLWKERKWDQVPGQIIPMRKSTFERAYNWIVNVKIVPNLYYIGLFVEDKDLDTQIELSQFVQGRKYRRYLVAEYARRNIYRAQRDNSYDFLEISPMYGKDNF